MREELIRVDHGCFRREELEYRFDLSVSRGECIGIYVDDHMTSGTACLDIFKGVTQMTQGKAFSCGARVSWTALERWIRQKSMIVDKYRFDSRELTVWDFVLALGKTVEREEQRSVAARLAGAEAAAIYGQMGLELPMELKLAEVSMLDYYRLCVFRVWLWGSELLLLDRITEVLRQKDLEQLMRSVQLLLEHGTAVMIFDLDESFLYRHCDRIDVIKDKKTCYRLYPEEYGEKLYAILGWKHSSGGAQKTGQYEGGREVLRVSNLRFSGMPPLDFQIRSGEIALLRDENYSTAVRLRSCLLGELPWLGGTFRLDGTGYSHSELSRLVGTEIGIQLERPDRSNGVLFDNLTALDNLTTCLLPKAGKWLAARRFKENILNEAAQWFPKEALQKPLNTWSLPQRLRFSYYKWYLLNPKLLVCFFPFVGQETAYHEMIIDLLVTCAERGMAIWVITSGIDAICEKTQNQEFLRRLRYLN